MASVCELCAGAHETNQCWSNQGGIQQPQQLYQQFQGQQYGAQPYNHQNFQQQYAPWQSQPPGFQQQQSYAGSERSSYDNSELEELRLIIKSNAVSFKNMENLIEQITNALLNKPQGTIPSETVANPGKGDVNEQVEAVTLRSGRATNDQKSAATKDEEVHIHQVEKSAGPEIEKSDFAAEQLDGEVEKSTKPVEKAFPEQSTNIYLPPPYPKRLLEFLAEEEECFGKSDPLDVALQGKSDTEDEELGLADLWDSKVLINEVVSWSNLEGSAIESFLEKDALLEYESNKDLHELYRNFTSDEMFEELNAICSKHEIHLEESSFDPKSVVKTFVGEPPTSVTNPSISTLDQSLVVHNENHHVEEASKLKLKPPDHLRYDYLGQSSTLLIIIVANFSGSKENNVTDTFEEQGMLKLVIKKVAPEKIIKWPYTKVTWHVFGLKIYYGGAIDRQSVSIILADV